MIFIVLSILLGLISLFLWKWLALIFMSGAVFAWVIGKKRIKVNEILYALSLQAGILSINAYGLIVLVISLISSNQLSYLRAYIFGFFFDVILVAILLILLYTRPGKGSIIALSIYQTIAILVHLLAILSGSQRIAGQLFLAGVRALSILFMLLGTRNRDKQVNTFAKSSGCANKGQKAKKAENE